jgi:DNA-binding XRE family transcriptional regulator
MKTKVISLKKEAEYFDRSVSKALKNKKIREAYESEGLRQTIALQIHEVRVKKHITQKQLAKRLSVPQQEISRIENGGQNITTDLLGKLVTGLHAKVKVQIY